MRGPGRLQNDFDSWFMPGRVLFLLAVLVFVTYPGLVIGTRAFAYRDAGLFTYPVAYYFRYCVWHGQWPLWNPYNNCGIPFLAQWNTMTLYPPSCIYLALPMPWSLNIFLFAHLFLAALGMYRLAREWFGSRFGASVAALAFAWNGLSLEFLAWSLVATYAWMPWVIFCCWRALSPKFPLRFRYVFWAALTGAFQMLTGSPETAVFTWLIVGAILIVRLFQREMTIWGGGTRLLSIVLLVCALSAAQLLPWLDLLMYGDRSSATGGGDDWSLPAWGLANFLVPLFHTTPSITGVFMQPEQQLISSYYLGILPLLLAVAAVWCAGRIRNFLLGLMALTAILLAFGRSGYLLDLARHAFPLLGFTRYPIKYIVVAIFGLSLLAGAGGAWLQTQSYVAIKSALRPLVGLFALAILILLAVEHWFPFPTDSWNDVFTNGVGRLVVLAAGAGLLMLAFAARPETHRVLFGFCFLFLAGVDISFHQPRQNPSVPASAYADRIPEMSAVPSLGESRAMLSPGADRTLGVLVNSDPLQMYLGERAELYENCNLLNRIPKTSGFFGIHLAWQRKIDALLDSEKSLTSLLDFLGVSQIAPPDKLFTWESQTGFMPWATIGQGPVFEGDWSTPSFNPRKAVRLEVSPQAVEAVVDPEAQIVSSNIQPGECDFETSASKTTMLVIAQAYYHCWRATVDGNHVPLFRANGAYQALQVPAGQHKVRLVYRDRPFYIGLGITLAALIGCLAGVSKNYRNSSHSGSFSKIQR
ncbi:MAG TPA: YfhO family protein [Verrucomicrobiae bacterium]